MRKMIFQINMLKKIMNIKNWISIKSKRNIVIIESYFCKQIVRIINKTNRMNLNGELKFIYKISNNTTNFKSFFYLMIHSYYSLNYFKMS